MRKFILLLLFTLISFSYATPPNPPNLKELSIDEAADLIERLSVEVPRDIYNICTFTEKSKDVINCMDWALLWYLKANNGTRPVRARLIANDAINHLFIGMNITGVWIFYDAQLSMPMQSIEIFRKMNYQASENYDVTEFMIKAYTTGYEDYKLLRELKRVQVR